MPALKMNESKTQLDKNDYCYGYRRKCPMLSRDAPLEICAGARGFHGVERLRERQEAAGNGLKN
jgi:hypothetical protein